MTLIEVSLLAALVCFNLALLLLLTAAATVESWNLGTRLVASLGILVVFFLVNAGALEVAGARYSF